MGKNPYFVLLAGLLFAWVPFLVTADISKELYDLEVGLESLKNITAKYEAEVATKTIYDLLKSIDVIDLAMGNYRGNATNKLETLRQFKFQVYHDYTNAIFSTLDRIRSIYAFFKLFNRNSNNVTLSSNEIKILQERAIDSGLNETAILLEKLGKAEKSIADFANQFMLFYNDVNDDFGPEGFYGRNEAGLEDRMFPLYFRIGGVIYRHVIKPYGTQDKDQGLQKKTNNEHQELIYNFFTTLFQTAQQNIEDVHIQMRFIEGAVKEDKSNLIKLQKVIDDANNLL
nr:uncharacterized protein LOC108127427 [Drosophila bipectinata]